jgi:hypothetical protein
LNAANPASALQRRRVAADVDPARTSPSSPKQRVSELELRQASLGLRTREFSLVLGTLLIFAGILAALIAARTTAAGTAPFGLIGGGVALLRFAGRRSESAF